MPQATGEDHALMELWFGDPILDHGPIEYLKSHGFMLTPQWEWLPPVPHHSVSCYEWRCVLFLIREWDFGGLVEDFGPTVCLCGHDKEAKHA